MFEAPVVRKYMLLAPSRENLLCFTDGQAEPRETLVTPWTALTSSSHLRGR